MNSAPSEVVANRPAIRLTKAGSQSDVTQLRSLTARSLLKSTGLQAFLDAGAYNEVSINRPGEIWTKAGERWELHAAPACTLEACRQLVNALAIFNGTPGGISADNPMLGVELPDGQRGQMLIPPACERDTVCLTIRIAGSKRFSLQDFISTGRLSGFDDVSEHLSCPPDVPLLGWERELMDAKAAKDVERFLREAVHRRLNFAFVGSTGSGKTAFTKAVVDLVPQEERIATIEDNHELSLPNHPNRGHFFYGAHATAKQLIAGMMRWNPHRIFLTELRGDEAWDYLGLLKAGHPGSVTSVHANDARSAPHRIANLVKQSQVGQTLEYAYILREVLTTIDVVMYFQDTYLRELSYDPVRKWKLLQGGL